MKKLKEEMIQGDFLRDWDKSVIEKYIEILNHPDSLTLVQSLNRELANIRYHPIFQEVQLEDNHMLTLSHL